MRFARTAIGFAAFSPAILLTLMGGWGRWATFGSASASDAGSYGARLAAFRPFVAAAARLAERPHSFESLEACLKEAQSARLGNLPAVFGTPPGRDDFRKPILEAQARVFNRGRAACQSLIARGDTERASRLLLQLHRLTLLTREFGFSAFVATSNQRTQLAELIQSFRLTVGATASPTLQVIEMAESTVRPPYDIMRHDVRLLTLDYRLTNEAGENGVLVRVADEAMQRAIAGENIRWYLDRISKWPQSSDRDRLWQMIASWQIMLKRYALDKKHLSSAIGV